ncbi:Ferredoxin [Trebouxia sp. C0010 RCD-2024]
MQITSATPLGSRYSTINGSHRHARQSLQRRLQPRQATWSQKCTAFHVTLITPEGEKTIQCDDSTLLLDAADEAGLDLPYSCRSGSCGTCAAKLEGGDMSKVEQDDNSFLEDFMMDNGYFLTCSSYPKGDITVKTHQEDNVYD